MNNISLFTVVRGVMVRFNARKVGEVFGEGVWQVDTDTSTDTDTVHPTGASVTTLDMGSEYQVGMGLLTLIKK